MSDTLDEEIPAHAPFGPSAADGWTTCLDYVNANRGLPDDTHYAAAEGTAAHGISHLCATTGLTAYDMVGQRTRLLEWTFQWTSDDADMLQPGLDRFAALPGEFFGEKRVDISKWTVPGQFGTLDRAKSGPDAHYVEDLKWGRGIPVTAYRCLQIVLYALGYWDQIGRHISDTRRFVLSIDQPRHSGGGGEWETTLDELLEIGDWIRGRAQLAILPNPPRTASDKGCRWCKRKVAPGGCGTYEEFMLDLVGDLMSNEPVIDIERRSHLLRHKSMIERWLETLEEQALADGLAGRATGTHKVVLDRKGRDKFVDPEAAETAVKALLGSAAYNTTLVTPTQARKKIDSWLYEEFVSPIVIVGQKKPKLVPVEDARPALTPVEQKMDEEDGD